MEASWNENLDGVKERANIISCSPPASPVKARVSWVAEYAVYGPCQDWQFSSTTGSTHAPTCKH